MNSKIQTIICNIREALSLRKGSSRTRKAKKNIYLSFIIKGLSVFISLLLVPIVVNSLGKEKYGIWVVLVSILQWFVYLDFGIGNGLRNRLSSCLAKGDYSLGKQYVSTAYFYSFLIFTSLGVFVSVCSLYLNWHSALNLKDTFDENIHLIIILLVILFFSRFFVQIVKNVFFALQLPFLREALETTGQLIVLISVYFISIYKLSSLLSFSIIYGVGPLLAFSIFTIFFFQKNKEIRPSLEGINKELSGGIFKLGAGFLIIQLTVVFLLSSTQFLINYFLGAASSADYAISLKLIGQLRFVNVIVLTPFWSAVTEAYTRKDYSWIRNSYKKTQTISIVIACSCFVLAFVSPLIYEFWLRKVEISSTMTWLNATYLAVFIATLPIMTFVNGTGRIKQQTIISIIIILTSVPLGILLFKSSGLGAASFIIPPVLGRFIAAFFGYLQLKKEHLI